MIQKFREVSFPGSYIMGEYWGLEKDRDKPFDALFTFNVKDFDLPNHGVVIYMIYEKNN